jgi:hypothetical protein
MFTVENYFLVLAPRRDDGESKGSGTEGIALMTRWRGDGYERGCHSQLESEQ